MNKKLPYIALVTLILGVLFTVVCHQEQKQTAREKYSDLIENHPIQKRLAMTKKQRKKAGIPPNKFFDQQYLLEMDPVTGKTYPQHIEDIKAYKSRKVKTFGVPGQNDKLQWIERGPNNIGGRTRVVFFDPNDSSGKRVFAGGVSGGLWVNNDITQENSQWTQIGIDENLAITCFSIDPNNSNIWYIGTGESYTFNEGTGNGLWKTKNGGATWEKVFSVDLNVDEDDRVYFINEVLAWDNNGRTEVFISVDIGLDYEVVGNKQRGWKKSIDGGITFNNINFSFNNSEQIIPYAFSQVEIASDNAIWVATTSPSFLDFDTGGGKIFRSTDGINFELKHNFNRGLRTEFTISKQNPDKIYAVCFLGKDRGVELVKTTDGFDSFEVITKPVDVDKAIKDDFTRNQGNHNLVIAVDPIDDEIVYTGGIDLFQTIDGGNSWRQISRWNESIDGLKDLKVSEVHADMHGIVFQPNNSNQMVFANDGGVYYSANINNALTDTLAIQARNNGYNVTQFYSVALEKFGTDNFEVILGGAQDNGSLFSYGAEKGINGFQDIFGGDGIMNFIDKDGEYIITSFIHNVYASRVIPLTEENVQDPPLSIVDDQDSGAFVNAADLDDNLDILYTNGSAFGEARISRYTDLLDSPNRTNFSHFTFSGDPTAIKVSPYTTTSSTVLIGTDVGEIVKATNLNTDNPSWENIDLNFEINPGAISAFDLGANEDEIMVTLHNYGINNIYYTSDGGLTWEEKDGNFPDIPVKDIKMNPLLRNEVIIGTNLGVWRTENFKDTNPTWELSSNGMSNVRVTHFDYDDSDNTVAAATYGRGIFTGKFEGNIQVPDELEFQIPSKLEDGQLSVTPADFEGKGNVQLSAVNGKVILDQTVVFSIDNPVKLDVNITDGIYIIKLLYRGKTTIKKIYITNN